MQPDDRDAAYLWDMRDAAQEAMSIAQRISFEHFLIERSQERLAIERLIEIIGEAARRISDHFRDSHPEVPWASMIAARCACRMPCLVA